MLINIETDNRIIFLKDIEKYNKNNSIFTYSSDVPIDILTQSRFYWNASYSNSYGIINKIDQTNFINYRITNTITDINDINHNSTLYFSKNCVFPRYKLQDTSFKRCVKANKADYVIIPFVNTSCRDLDNNYFSDVKYKLIHNDAEIYFGQRLFDYFDCLKNNTESISISNVLTADSKIDALGILDIINNKDKKFIYDKDLEKIICKNQEDLDKETLMSLYDMLSSSDDSSVELGCKLLSSYNVINFSLTTAILLKLTFDKWLYNKGSKSVSFNSMLNLLHYPKTFLTLNEIFLDYKPSSELDKELSKLLIEPYFYQTIENCFDFKIENCPYKINFNITFE